MSRALTLTAIALCILLAVGCSPSTAIVGSKAPDIEFERITQPGLVQYISDPKHPVHLSDFKGQVVLIDLWATWCVPCKLITPKINQFMKTYGHQGFVALGISDETREQVERYAKAEPHDFPLFTDPTGKVKDAYPGEWIPRLYVIDRNGNVAYASTIATKDPVSEAEQAIKKCLEISKD